MTKFYLFVIKSRENVASQIKAKSTGFSLVHLFISPEASRAWPK